MESYAQPSVGACRGLRRRCRNWSRYFIRHYKHYTPSASSCRSPSHEHHLQHQQFWSCSCDPRSTGPRILTECAGTLPSCCWRARDPSHPTAYPPSHCVQESRPKQLDSTCRASRSLKGGSNTSPARKACNAEE